MDGSWPSCKMQALPGNGGLASFCQEGVPLPLPFLRWGGHSTPHSLQVTEPGACSALWVEGEPPSGGDSLGAPCSWSRALTQVGFPCCVNCILPLTGNCGPLPCFYHAGEPGLSLIKTMVENYTSLRAFLAASRDPARSSSLLGTWSK